MGVIIGGFINGWAAAKFGYRKTLQTALALQTGFIFISFFAQSVEMLLVGQMVRPTYNPQLCTIDADSETALWADMGRLRYDGASVCVGGLSFSSTRLSNHLRELLLGHGSVHQ